ncbi:MAG: hypothetical protein KF760_19745 [Candidatus Eremiobacteraeota bacterium]|nr:hypothetical protein [Candidatus Eremiobacteraeota bacterium]MCW5869143.1 hypothetical protein [Candidatus Eremiobacteraeota bacterium]
MAIGMGGGLGDTSWVDQQMNQMRGGGLGGGLAQSLNQVPGLDSGSAKNWVDQQMGSMGGAGGVANMAGSINQVPGLDSGSAKNWVDQQLGGGSLGGGLGGLGGGSSLLGGLGSNFGSADPLQAAAEQQRNLQMAQMLGSAGLAPGGGLGAASPLGGLV